MRKSGVGDKAVAGNLVGVSRSASDESVVEKRKQRVPAADIDNIKTPH